tara:strand:- start:86 stop:394 length:309 start_codon:yes stop_codon:yes gene_type:complete
MIFKYKGQEMEVPDNFIVMCGEHAAERGMTLEEYIAEAFTMLNSTKMKEVTEAAQKTIKKVLKKHNIGMDDSGVFETDVEEPEYDIGTAPPISKDNAENGSW